MTSIGIRLGVGLLISAAPLALASAVAASEWTSLAQALPDNPFAGPAVGAQTSLAQTPETTQASDAERTLLERARYWKARSRPDLAQEALERLLRSNPSHLQALHEMGLLAAQQGNVASARQYLSRLRSAHPSAAREIAELEKAVQMGQIDPAEIAAARRMAEAGSFEQAVRRYQQAFRGAEPSGAYALEYYLTLAGTATGYDEGRRGLEALARTGDLQARLALAKVLTYRDGSRREGIRRLQALANEPAVAADAVAAWRQALMWLGTSAQDRALYDAYLAARPNDAEIRARRDEATRVLRASTASRAARSSGPSRSARLRIQGFEELNQGDLADAETRFREALRLRPSDADALAGLGIVRLRQDRFAEARDLLGRAVRDAAARRRYAEAYATASFWAGMEEAEAAFDGGRYGEAERILNDLIGRNSPDAYHARRLLGDVYLRQGREDAAERQYQAVLRSQPNDVGAMTGLFNVYSAQNRTQDALALAGRIEAAGAQSGGVRAGVQRLRAKQYELAGADEAAFAAYQDAIVADPTDPWLRLDFARFLARRGERDQANAMMQAIVDTDGAPPAALQAAAIYFGELEMWNEGIAAIDRIPPASQTAEIRQLRDRMYLTAQLARARALSEAGATAEARRLLEELYRTPPQTPERTGLIASAMADIGDARRAQSILRPLIAQHDASPDTRLQYVNVLLKAGQEAEAAAFLRQLDGDPRLTPAQRRELADKAADLAVMQADRAREARNFADAYDILYPHLAASPDNPNLLLALARLYASADHPEEARSIYAAVLERDPANLPAIRGAIGAAIDARDFDYATQLVDTALAYHPHEPRVYYLLGEIARARGDLGTARQALETAQELRQREIAEIAAVSTDGRPLPPNPFRNLGAPESSRLGFGTTVLPPASYPAPGPVGPNPFRSGNLGDAAGSAPVLAAEPAPPEPVGEQVASADPGYVSMAQAAPRARPAPAPIAAPPPAAPAPVAAGSVYVPPFVDPAARARREPDNLTRDIERSLAAIQRETGPSVQAGARLRARDGDSGLDRMREFTTPLEATWSPAGIGKLTATLTPTYLDAGNVSSDQLRRFGLNNLGPELDPGEQDAAGVGFSLGFSTGPFAVDAGVTPVGFELINFVGGASFAPMLDENIGLRFTVEQRAVTDSVLSYAGTKDPRSGDLDWGGVVRTGGRAEINFDDGLVGAYLNGGYYELTGDGVADNDMVEANVGGYYRFIRTADEELRGGVNISYLSYDRNLRYFSMGHGGYFSPQNYLAFSIPIEYRRSYRRIRYTVGGAIGVQDWSEDSAPWFPDDAAAQAALEATSPPGTPLFYPEDDQTNLGFNLRGQIEYDVSDRTVIGAAASFDNAADWFELTAGVYVRHLLGWN